MTKDIKHNSMVVVEVKMDDTVTHEIRLCRLDEIAELKSFLHFKWKENHILSVDDNLLNWQHKGGHYYNFIIAKNTTTLAFDALLGFIPLAHYDKGLASNNDYWLAIWKADNDTEAQKGLGLKVFNYFLDVFKPNSIGSIGINAYVKKIYNLLAFKTSTLQQYFILNPDVENYTIAKVADPFLFNNVQSEYLLKEIDDIGSLGPEIISKSTPQKSVLFFVNKYVRHPTYKYFFWGIYSNKNVDISLKVVLVVRKITNAHAHCFRIIDVMGDVSKLGNIAGPVIKKLKTSNAEYIDFYCSNNLPDALGFYNRNNFDIIIPNYFEPFEQKNVDVLFATYPKSMDDYTIYKGDSDQDRPSLML